MLDRSEVLFHQGSPGDCLYLVKTGRLRVIHNLGLPDESIVGEVGPGEPVGELALLWSSTRSATVIAIRFTELARISRAAFEQLTQNHPSETMELMRVVAWRLKQSYERPPRHSLPSILAVIPAAGDVPLAETCERLMEFMPNPGTDSRLITGRDVPQAFRVGADFTGGPNDRERQHLLASWLNEQAEKAATTILQADKDLTPWTDCCLRQADLILILAHAKSDPTPGPIEQALAGLSYPNALPRLELVLLHDKATYRGTSAWLRPRNVARHYHVRLDSAEDRARAARLLTGKDHTLVLGGGGARGLAHIGVFRACQEIGLPIDRVGGVSMGSVIGGMIAQGSNWNEVNERMRHHMVNSGKLTQLTLPAVSFDSARRYLKQLERMFGDTQIEDLPINFFCVSSSLSRARVLVHRSGSMTKWIGGSSSVPGVAPPLVEKGELITDGGVLNNLPIDVALDDKAGRVIAVDVSPEVDLLMPETYSGRPRAGEVLGAWLRRRLGIGSEPAVNYPSIFSLLFRASILNSIPTTAALRKRADLFIQPPVAHCKLFEWARFDEIVEIGRREGAPALSAFMAEGLSPGSLTETLPVEPPDSSLEPDKDRPETATAGEQT